MNVTKGESYQVISMKLIHASLANFNKTREPRALIERPLIGRPLTDCPLTERRLTECPLT